MLEVTDELKEKYLTDSVSKKLIIRFPNEEHEDITNSQILSESMSLNEMLSDGEQLKFGLCNSAKFEVTVAEVVANIKGCEIAPVIAIGDTEIPLGVFIVTEVEKNAGRPYKKITALDKIQYFNDDVKGWYATLTFPMTIKQFRDSLFNYMEIEQVETTLVNDNISFTATTDTTSYISGLEILQGICEINGMSGRMNRYGKFEYVNINFPLPLYPSNDLYPSEDLYPTEVSNGLVVNSILKNTPIVEDYQTEVINGVILDIDNNQYTSDSHTNPYVIANNFLAYAIENHTQLANNIASVINGLTYTPAEIKVKGVPFLECGDIVLCELKGDLIMMPILERTLTGIQSLTDEFKARGTEFMEHDYNSVSSKLQDLNRRTDDLVVQVNVTNQGLQTKVAKNEIISTINQSAEEVSINANKINLNGVVTANNNFKINEDGSMEAVNGTFKGKGTFDSFEINEMVDEMTQSKLIAKIENGVFIIARDSTLANSYTGIYMNTDKTTLSNVYNIGNAGIPMRIGVSSGTMEMDYSYASIYIEDDDITFTLDNDDPDKTSGSIKLSDLIKMKEKLDNM